MITYSQKTLDREYDPTKYRLEQYPTLAFYKKKFKKAYVVIDTESKSKTNRFDIIYKKIPDGSIICGSDGVELARIIIDLVDEKEIYAGVV